MFNSEPFSMPHTFNSPVLPVILCGGSGTRLWPLSRKSFPKQFVPLIENKSLLQLTLERVKGLSEGKVMCVAADEHRFMVSEALQAAYVSGSLILEPSARNTAAAMAAAALFATKASSGSIGELSHESLLLFCPADHHIPDTEAFLHTVAEGIPSAEAGAIVTYGVVPSFPSTAYGYIEQAEKRNDGAFKVVRFIEKPNSSQATELLLKGNVLWNAGIFLIKASTLIKALEAHAPDILIAVTAAMESAKSEELETSKSLNRSKITFIRPEKAAFSSCRSQSIDYALMEHYSDISVIPFKGQWSDVGSWNAVADLATPDNEDNRIFGQGVAHHSKNTYIHASHRPVVALGTQDLLIIDTPDAVLVAHRDHAERVKEVVARLENEEYAQAITHRKVARPWGWYDSIDMGERFQVKRIGVKPGASLSLQKHHHRAEHWIVVKGTAEVTRGKETFLLSENESTYIPIGEVHRLKNPGKLPLEMIEVQSGSYLGEDDIVRLEDVYGR
jgi:mannose-1-phosphate guanylyltransferase / mannose-6-phosphate isomerase